MWFGAFRQSSRGFWHLALDVRHMVMNGSDGAVGSCESVRKRERSGELGGVVRGQWQGGGMHTQHPWHDRYRWWSCCDMVADG
jgi:hypothetical protein